MGCKTKEKGDISQAVIVAELMKAGVVVLTPFGDNQPYDLVVNHQQKFLRLQCKTGWVKDDVLLFKTRSTNPRSSGKCVEKSYDGLIDYFMIYCPDNNKVYLMTIDGIPKGTASLRLSEPKNNQKKKIKLAQDYEFKLENLI